MKYDIFLSYSRKDRRDADRLKRDIEGFGYRVWLDREEMQGGELWREQIRAAIDDVNCVVVLFTPHSIESEFVTEEWKYAQSCGKPIFGFKRVPCRFPSDLEAYHHFEALDEDNYYQDFVALLKGIRQFDLRVVERSDLRIEADIRGISDIYIAGGSSLGVINDWKEEIPRILKDKGARARFLILHPDMEAWKFYEMIDVSERREIRGEILQSLTACEFINKKKGDGLFEVRLLRMFLPYAIVGLNTHRQDGKIRFESRGYKISYTERPSFLIRGDHHPHWYRFFNTQFKDMWADSELSEAWNFDLGVFKNT